MKDCIKPFSILLILCLGVLVYSNTFHSSFHFDDVYYLLNNFATKNILNWQNIWAYYPTRTVLFLSFVLTYHFFQLNVFGFHLVNIIIHLGAAVLVWWLVLMTLSTPAMKEDKITRHANPIALFAALIFVAHPVQTEAVTYIWQRAASLAAFFYLASLCLYVKSRLLQDRDSNSIHWQLCYISSLLIAIIAMFTKEFTITLPLMVLLYEFSFFRTGKDLNWRNIVPFLLILLIIPLTILLAKSAEDKLPVNHISSLHYFLTQLRVMVTYIRLLFLPFHQNLDYDYPVFKSIWRLPVLFSALFLAGILWAAKRLFLKYRLVAFSIFWFFLTVLPESSFLPFKDLIFEHRLYLPLAGYSIFLVSTLYYFFFRPGSFASLRMTVVILSMITVFYSILAYQRNEIWKDDISLWTNVIHQSPNKARGYINLGIAYGKLNDLNRGLAYLDKGVALDPGNAEEYTARGFIYQQQGKLYKAVVEYTKAVIVNPKFWMAYYARGYLFKKLGDYRHCIVDFSKIIDIYPYDPTAHFIRGVEYNQMGKFKLAIADFDKTIELDPNYQEAYAQRALAMKSLK